jgi:molybdate transport system substrate-binding protein
MLRLLMLLCLAITLPAQATDKLTIAAASDLRYALSEIMARFRLQRTELQADVIFGASGKLSTQIRHGAPYDMFFSADISFPEQLYQDGLAVTVPQRYALGHLVLWSPWQNMSGVELQQLSSMTFRRLAIAQPAHAPYGQRAKEALQTIGLWAELEPKLVYGENIAQTAQMVQSGGAEIGIIALSLAKFPELARHGYAPISASLHQPLTQAFVITRHGAANNAAKQFAAFMLTKDARAIMQQYGFGLPDEQE